MKISRRPNLLGLTFGFTTSADMASGVVLITVSPVTSPSGMLNLTALDE